MQTRDLAINDSNNVEKQQTNKEDCNHCKQKGTKECSSCKQNNIEQPISRIKKKIIKYIDTDKTFLVTVLIATLVLTLFTFSMNIWSLLLLSSNSKEGTQGNVTEPFKFVSRLAWDAREPRNTTKFSHQPVNYVIIIHTGSQRCSSFTDCSRAARDIQKMQMDMLDDIAYNFLVGGNGEVYEGRGWDVVGDIFDNRTLTIAFIGFFQYYPPPVNQLEHAQTLLSESVKRGKLASDYTLIGPKTLSLGQALIDIVRTWPHWKDMTV